MSAYGDAWTLPSEMKFCRSNKGSAIYESLEVQFSYEVSYEIS